MGSRVGLALAVFALLLGGCGGSNDASTSEETNETLTAPSGPAQTEVEEKRQEEAEKATEQQREEQRIREHEPGHFGP
jgi:ABC-type glycerol-3-phosphate transport system substrate-binding protein